MNYNSMVCFYKKYPDGSFELVGKCHAYMNPDFCYFVPVRNVLRILKKYPTDFLWAYDRYGRELSYSEEGDGVNYQFWRSCF